MSALADLKEILKAWSVMEIHTLRGSRSLGRQLANWAIHGTWDHESRRRAA